MTNFCCRINTVLLIVQHKLTFGEEWVNYRLQKEGHTLDGILLFFFYLLLHTLYGN